MKTFLARCIFIFAAAVNAQQVKSVKITDLENTIKESKTPLIVNFGQRFVCLASRKYLISRK